MAKQGQWEGEQRGYLSGVEMSRRWRPSRGHPCYGCGESSTSEESPLSSSEVSVQAHPSRGHPSCGRTGGSITWGIPVWAWQAPGGPGEGGRSSKGHGNVGSWEVRCKMDPSRAGPGSSNVREQREGEGNVLLAGSTGQLQWRKVAQGQVHKMPRLVFILSCRTIVRN